MLIEGVWRHAGNPFAGKVAPLTHAWAVTDTPNEPGWLILAGFIALIVGPPFLAVDRESSPAHDVITGAMALGIGASFLLAFYFEHKSVLFRGLMLLCEKGSVPASRKMAFFYAGLLGVCGTMDILQGLGFSNAPGNR